MKLTRAFWNQNASLKMKVKYWERQLLGGRHDTYAVEQYFLLSAELDALKEEAYEALKRAKLERQPPAPSKLPAEWNPCLLINFQD